MGGLAGVMNSPLSWDEFRLVKAIADSRSLVGAAELLGLNHSTVFRRLGAIETTLGAQLFERSRAGIKIMFSERREAQSLREVLEEVLQLATLGVGAFSAGNTPKSVALAIGPEGGWTPEEMSLFTQHQWQSVTLGPRILRAETAAIAAIAIAATHLC